MCQSAYELTCLLILALAKGLYGCVAIIAWEGKSRVFGELENFLTERGLDKQLGCNGYKELGQSYMLTTSAKILLSSP